MALATEVKDVPFFNYPAVFRESEEEFVEIFREVGRRGAFIKQRDLEQFENELAGFISARHALGVGNATDGLEVALLAAGIGKGDEVIFCTHTMLATATAIYFAGATPVPVDCGPDHLISPESVEAAVTPRTRAIMPTQLNGRTCDMDALGAIAQKHGLLIVEDAAQALGSRFRGRCAGTFGIASAISFYPAKVLGCLGDGGAILTSDSDVFRRMGELCDFGRARDGRVVRWGFNSRLDNLQAAILRHQLARYDTVIARRRSIASLYDRRLSSVPELTLPPAPDSDPSHFDIFQNYEIEADCRDQLKIFLAERGVGTLIQWGGQGVHEHEALGLNVSLPYTERLLRRMLMLPLNMSMPDDDVEYVCDQVREFYGR